MSVARSRPEFNLKEASWQHKFTFVPRALFAIGGKLLPCTDNSNFMSILDELPNQDKSTDSQQAKSSTAAGISIRDSKGTEYNAIYLVFDPYLTSSLKETSRERRFEESTPVGKVTAKQFLSSIRNKDELTGLPLGLIRRLDRVLRSAARLIGHIPKCASDSAYMRDVLHWLPVSQRILYRVSALVWRSATGCAQSID